MDNRHINQMLRIPEKSQKSAKGVHLTALADYLDAKAEEGRRELHSIVRT